jgi:hypothetical protein
VAWVGGAVVLLVGGASVGEDFGGAACSAGLAVKVIAVNGR